MCFGDNSKLYAGVCNAWSTTVSDLRETGIAYGMAWKNINPSLSEVDLYKSPLEKKMTVGLMLLSLEHSCISGNPETSLQILWPHMCCLKSQVDLPYVCVDLVLTNTFC